MHTTFVKSFTAALLAISALSAANAQAATPQDQHTQYTQYIPTEQEVGQFDNVYKLDNGQILTLNRQDGHYFAELQGKRQFTLYPQAPGVFVTARGVRLELLNQREQVVITDAGLLPGARIETDTPSHPLASR